jgi:hypothetical protein
MRVEDPIIFFRQRQGDIYIVGVSSVLPCITLLIFLKAPSPLIASIVLLLAISLGVALVHKPETYLCQPHVTTRG